MEEKTSIIEIREVATRPSEHRPCLTVIAGKMAGKLYKISGDTPLVIGRGFETQVRIEDDGISRRHAQVYQKRDGSIAIEDLGSTNGTYVNGEKKPVHVLQDGDKIELGSNTILKFSYADNVEEEYQRKLYDSATRDALTGCYNKKYFVERLATEFSYASRHGTELSLCVLDLDHFKRVNDSYGHPAGDAVLRHFSQLVQQMIRSDDIFCRYGGEEFCLILRQTPTREAYAIAERVRRQLEIKAAEHAGQRIPITCSIGIATHSASRFSSPQDFLKATDDLLYQAKQGGRNRTVMLAAAR